MKTYNVKIEQDIEPDNPRDWENMGTMLCWHKRYTLGDENNYKHSNFSSWEDLEATIDKEEDSVVIFPLYMYEHGGVTISTTPFSCHWDSGRIGLIFVRREDVLKEKLSLKQVEEYLRQEVATYDQYLTGDVWGYTIEDEEGECLESCWGFFGREFCEQEAAQQVEVFKKQEIADLRQLKAAQSAMACCQP